MSAFADSQNLATHNWMWTKMHLLNKTKHLAVLSLLLTLFRDLFSFILALKFLEGTWNSSVQSQDWQQQGELSCTSLISSELRESPRGEEERSAFVPGDTVSHLWETDSLPVYKLSGSQTNIIPAWSLCKDLREGWEESSKVGNRRNKTTQCWVPPGQRSGSSLFPQHRWEGTAHRHILNFSQTQTPLCPFGASHQQQQLLHAFLWSSHKSENHRTRLQNRHCKQKNKGWNREEKRKQKSTARREAAWGSGGVPCWEEYKDISPPTDSYRGQLKWI